MIVGCVGQGKSPEYLEMLEGLKELSNACLLAGCTTQELELSLNIFKSSFAGIEKPLYASIYGNNKAYHYIHHYKKFRVRKKWKNKMLKMMDQLNEAEDTK